MREILALFVLFINALSHTPLRYIEPSGKLSLCHSTCKQTPYFLITLLLVFSTCQCGIQMNKQDLDRLVRGIKCIQKVLVVSPQALF